jgi:hypothetical protein
LCPEQEWNLFILWDIFAGGGIPTGLIKTNYTISDEKTSSMDATVIFLGFGPGYDDRFGFKE